MFAPTIVRNDLTIATYGYDVESLSSGSHSFVIVECANCNSTMRKEWRNRHRKHQCPIVVGNTKRCFMCERWKDLSLFNKNGKLSGGVSKLCRKCYNEHSAVKKCNNRRQKRLKVAAKENDYRFYIKRRYSSLKSRCGSNIPYNIDIDYLISLWESQNGYCYYTELPMIGSGINKGIAVWNSPSLDRLSPSDGYIVDNLVWCLNCINSFKGQLSEDGFRSIVQSINWRWAE